MSPPQAPHVLLVEDNEATRYAVARVLRGAGYRVSAAETGERGVTMTRELRPDLVLLDVKLPDVMGFEVVAELRADPATAGIPIVHLSATHVSNADQIRGLEGGADAYLTHPIEPHVLVATLDALLRVRMAEARYRRLFTTGILGIVHWTLDGEIADANDEFLRIAGRDRRALSALRLSDLTPEGGRARVEGIAAELRATGVSRTVENELLRPDGSRVPVAVGAALLQGREGEAVAFVADLTPLRSAERERDRALASAREALARAEAAQRRMALLLRISGALVREPADPRAALREVAAFLVPDLCDGCAFDRAASSGAPERMAVATSADAPGAAAALEAPEAQGAAALAVPMGAHGRTVGVMTLVRTRPGACFAREEVELAQEVAFRAAQALDAARLYEELARAVRAREDALAEVSHDLRNPLSSISLGADAVERSLELPDAASRIRRTLSSMRRASDRMTRLVSDLLDLARLDAGRLDVELAAHPAARLVRTAVESQAALARERGIALREVEPPAGLLVHADAHRVQQVLENLLGNALKFTPAGRAVEVGARAAGPETVFWVRDEGPGIGPEQLAHVFERYWRAPGSDERGAGLGLSIARALVERQGGRIWVESEQGRGSTFAFTLGTAT